MPLLPASSVAASIAHLIGPGKIKILNGRLGFSNGSGKPLKLDIAALRSVLCYGPVGITDDALALVFRNGVQITWMSGRGDRCRGRLVQQVAHTAPLRVLQHRVLSDRVQRLDVARKIVRGKVESQQEAARHFQRQGRFALGDVLEELKTIHHSLSGATSLDCLRGFEGRASNIWFRTFGRLLTPPWCFPGRRRRPPTDPVNALLSLGYTLLTSRVQAQCEAGGLETHLGALHEERSGRPSLVCDLVEPLRVPAVDRWVVRMCNEQRIGVDDFVQSAEKGVRLRKSAFSRTLRAWEAHWQKNGRGRLELVADQFIRIIRESASAGACSRSGEITSEGEETGCGDF
jgi:CRISP-associated protein Cas1